jgi:nucleotide-binding universal stress UspA family protein
VPPGEDDLIVIGSSRRGAIGRVVAGDTVRATLTAAPCAVAVAPKGMAEADGSISRIGVGFDGSPESEMALDRAAALGRAAGASLDVVDVVANIGAPVFGWPYGFDVDELLAASRRTATELVDHATEGLDLPVRREVRFGFPGRELVEVSDRVDLLVVGSRGFGPARRVIAGSTSDYVVHHAHCPVVVLPRSAVEADAETPVAVEMAANA